MKKGTYFTLVRMTTAALLTAALLVSAGCSSVRTTNAFNGLDLATGKENVCHVSGSVSGLYLLSFPLLTGDARRPGGFVPVVTLDTVTLPKVSNMVSAKAKQLGARELLDVTSSRRSLWIAPLFVLFWETQEVSGNAVTDKAR